MGHIRTAGTSSSDLPAHLPQVCCSVHPRSCLHWDDGRFGPLSLFEGEWEGVTAKIVVYYKAGCVPQWYFDSISLGGRNLETFFLLINGEKMCPVPYFFQRSCLKLAEGYSSERISHLVAWIFSLGSSSSHRPGGLPLHSAQDTWEPHLRVLRRGELWRQAEPWSTSRCH